MYLDSRVKLTTDGSNTNLRESSNTLTPDDAIRKTSHPKRSGVFTSVGNLNTIDDTDSDDDIDGTVEKVKQGLPKRASSYMDLRGSQASLNSVLSDTKARYGLDVSGEIFLTLTYSLTTGALDVLLNKCTNLAQATRHHLSDPYVKIYLLPDRSKNSKRKTDIKKNTINPEFEEKLRYHVTKQEFETRVLWVTVWSRTSVGHNDFLGEIHIPLANCVLGEMKEYKLLAKKNKRDLAPNIQPTMEPGEISFDLTFIPNPKTKGVGTLQVHHIEAKAIYYGKIQVDAICKGILMPDNIKRKTPNTSKGPVPKWEIPFRWEGVRLDHLTNTSIEMSIWCVERFKKTNLGFVRLNLAHGHFDNKPAKWLDSTNAEKLCWNKFIQRPKEEHHIKLPLRPAIVEK